MSFRSIVRFLPAAICIAVIFFVSSIPSQYFKDGITPLIGTGPQTIFLKIGKSTMMINRLKLGHVVGYATLGATLLYGFGRFVRIPWPWALGMSVLFALTDEWHQVFTPGRHPGWKDFILDIGAAGLAILLLTLAQWWRRRKAVHVAEAEA